MRGYDYHDPENARKARRLLKELAPRARVRARQIAKDAVYKSYTKIGEAMVALARLSNVEAVHIYRNDKGGWIADLELKKVPVGSPNVVGTPVMYPHKTREEALQQAMHMLAMAAVEDAKPKVSSAERWMELHGVSFRVPGDVLDKAVALAALVPPPPAHEVRAQLDALCADLFGGPPTGGGLDGLDDDGRLRLWATAALALTVGMFRHPEWAPRSPEESEADEVADTAARRKAH